METTTPDSGEVKEVTSAVALLSGGMDSAVLAYSLAREVDELHLMSFDYGQRHKGELAYAKRIADHLGAHHILVDLSNLQPLLAGSALTSADVPVPEGHYAADNMKITVVPNRNMIMLAIATGYAVSNKLEEVAAAMHAGDHFVYPDCRPAFMAAMREAIRVGNEGFDPPELHTPYIDISKADIVRIGDALEVPWEGTWSCYQGEAIHCGKCGTCVERKEAFQLAQIADPTHYEA